MKPFHLKSWFEKTKTPSFDEALVPSFKTLMSMKKQVPYLKGMVLKQTSSRSGDVKSAFKGRGIEFEEVRPYYFTDDVRDIDWRVTARKNQPYTKLYALEKDQNVYVWLDLSEKMYFGTKKSLKSVTAAKTAALLGWFSLSYNNRFGLAIYTGEKTYLFEARLGQSYFLSLLKEIEKCAKENLDQHFQKQTPDESLKLLEQKTGQNAILFLVGNFDLNNAKLMQEMALLMRRNEVYAVDIADALEITPPPYGDYMAEFSGQKELISNTGRHFEKAYRDHFLEKRRALKDFSLKYGGRYRLIQSDLPIAEQLRPV